MPWLLDIMLILSPLFSNLFCHVYRQTLYRNQVVNVQCAYHILTYKDWLMLWQTSIMSFGRYDSVDWIIFAMITFENLAHTETAPGRVG